MHARIDQLLSLRDGEPVDADVRAHVQHCATCLAEATALVDARSRLQTLPSFDPPAIAFDGIASRGAQSRHRRPALAWAAAVSAAVIAIAAFIVVRDATHPPQTVALPKTTTVVPQASDPEMQRLIAQSRELDELLHYLPDRPQVQRASLGATVDSIEERIQMLDLQLAYGSDAGLDDQQARRLWSERVELMDSLVKVRYAESAPMVF